jgi:hypothetical protein
MKDSTAMSDSSPTAADAVKLALQEIKDRLVEEAWFGEAHKREGFDVASAADKVAGHIEELTEQDNLYALGATYYAVTTRENASRFRNVPTEVRLTLTFLIISYTGLMAISLLKSSFFQEYSAVFALPVLISLPAADSIESWWKRARISLKTAKATKAATDVEKSYEVTYRAQHTRGHDSQFHRPRR